MVVALAVSPTSSFLSGGLLRLESTCLGTCVGIPAPAAAAASSQGKQPQQIHVGFHVNPSKSRGSSVIPQATRQFEAVASRTRKRRGKKPSSGSGDDDDQDEYVLGGGSGGGNDWGGSWGGPGGSWNSGGGSWGPGGPWHSGGSSGGYNNGAFRFNKAIYECMWFWQLLCAASLLQALHFVLVGGERKSSGAAAAASVTVATAAAVHAGSSL